MSQHFLESQTSFFLRYDWQFLSTVIFGTDTDCQHGAMLYRSSGA